MPACILKTDNIFESGDDQYIPAVSKSLKVQYEQWWSYPKVPCCLLQTVLLLEMNLLEEIPNPYVFLINVKMSPREYKSGRF